MAEFKILTDGSCELPVECTNDDRFGIVPFRFIFDGVPVAEKNMNIQAMMDMISNGVKALSACPSPDIFLKYMNCDAKRIYIITVSTVLSNCYKSAMMAKKIYDANYGDKEIFVINSNSASGAERRLALCALEAEEAGESFDTICDKLTKIRDNSNTFFLLKESASEATHYFKEATYTALDQMCEAMAKSIKESSPKQIIITHCNNIEKALKLKEMLVAITDCKDIIITNASALSSYYAQNGGIIVNY